VEDSRAEAAEAAEAGHGERIPSRTVTGLTLGVVSTPGSRISAGEARQEFPSTPASAGEARRFVESVMADADLDQLAYIATSLVSELVANAILHTGTPLTVVVVPDPGRVRIEVHDGSRQLPVRKHYSKMSGTGRGLMLVERLAARWGCERTASGKAVWFELEDQPAAVFDVRSVDAL